MTWVTNEAHFQLFKADEEKVAVGSVDPRLKSALVVPVYANEADGAAQDLNGKQTELPSASSTWYDREPRITLDGIRRSTSRNDFVRT